jgi:hypothetical protein
MKLVLIRGIKMKDSYKRFKKCDQIISYRFGKTLEETYLKTDTFRTKDDVVYCIQEKVSNYGPQNRIMSRVVFKIPLKKFTITKHLEAIDGACSDS